jgi:RNA polymerase sigma-70 factor (ECF subfamily)
MDRLDDTALMLLYAENSDIRAFEELYSRHKDAVFRYLLRNCRGRDAAEDVFQEVWSKIIKSRKSYRPTAKFTTFLYRIAHNAWIDDLRRNKRYGSGDDRTDLLVSDAALPEDSADKVIVRENILAALEDLPEPQRDAWLLREEAGLSIEEIAQVMGIGHEAAKSRLRYANTKLRQAMGIQ